MARNNLLKKIIVIVVLIQFSSLVFLYSLVPKPQTDANTLQPSSETGLSTTTSSSSNEILTTINNSSVVLITRTMDDKYPVKYNAEQEKEINEIIKQSNEKKFKGNSEEAVKILDLGIAKYPYSDLLYTYKGGVYFDQQNWVEAEKFYRKAYEYNPKSVWHASNIAIVLGQQGKKKEQIEFQKIAYYLEPNAQRLFSLYWDEWGMNDYNLYDKYFGTLMRGMRDMIKEGQYPPPEPFHALHFPFTASELLYISRTRADGLKNRHILE
jgi:tetratricopeptide (TPR) repeat protein